MPTLSPNHPTNHSLHHFLNIEAISTKTLETLLKLTKHFFDSNGRIYSPKPYLQGKIVANLFFEPSTRTLSSFELAAKHLSATVLTLNVATSSTKKGESLADTVRTIAAMQCDFIIVRHADDGAAEFVAREVGAHTSVINAGDGCHAHPTQALLDMFTLQQHFHDLSKLRVAIVGDILHSRVARSDITALQKLGVRDIRAVAPSILLPTEIEKLGVSTYTDLASGLKDVDVIITLRLQHERMHSLNIVPADYAQQYCITNDTLRYAHKDVKVMHPGPMNRGVEIADDVADGPHSLILEQVKNGVAARMAVLALIAKPELGLLT